MLRVSFEGMAKKPRQDACAFLITDASPVYAFHAHD